jgi:hypothetical protein
MAAASSAQAAAPCEPVAGAGAPASLGEARPTARLKLQLVDASAAPAGQGAAPGAADMHAGVTPGALGYRPPLRSPCNPLAASPKARMHHPPADVQVAMANRAVARVAARQAAPQSPVESLSPISKVLNDEARKHAYFAGRAAGLRRQLSASSRAMEQSQAMEDGE